MPETQDWGVAAVAQAAVQTSLGITATEAVTVNTLVAGVAGQRINLLQASLSPSFDLAGTFQLRDKVNVAIIDSISSAWLGNLAISPDSPFAVIVFAQGAASLNVLATLQYSAVSAQGAGAQRVGLAFRYYLSL